MRSRLGLIRWKIVIHAFIDGKTRLLVGIRAHNNNRARTVLVLFLDCVSVHGTPSRVRGDHGTENVEVAEWMEERRGQGRGSYIWGRSVRSPSIWLTSLAHDLHSLGVYTTAGLRGFGMMSLKGLAQSGRTCSLIWRPITDWTSTTQPTSGSYTISFSTPSIKMLHPGLRHGTATNYRYVVSLSRRHRRCSSSVCLKMVLVV